MAPKIELPKVQVHRYHDNVRVVSIDFGEGDAYYTASRMRGRWFWRREATSIFSGVNAGDNAVTLKQAVAQIISNRAYYLAVRELYHYG